ncbi:hypothetical protein MYX76_00960 [Desulfobacterota bacterium AH_259_B03_O07]|nr:hypothetical protein [Desulfobacterota bacterium AH_259_B03_O07]
MLEDIVGTGESKADALENFRDNARKACYETCKNSTCNLDGNEVTCSTTDPKSSCCYLEKWGSEDNLPLKHPQGGWQLSSKIECHCRCGGCADKKPRLVFAPPFQSEIKKKRTDAEKEVLSKARDWCSEYECIRFKGNEGKECTVANVDPAREHIKSPPDDDDNFISTYILESCECRCM